MAGIKVTDVDAFDSTGKRIDNAYVVDGRTYTADGKDISAGSVVRVGDRYWRKGGGEITAGEFLETSLPRESFAHTVTESSPIQTPTPMTGSQIKNTYGINNDRAEIEALFNDVIDANYAKLNAQQARSTDQFYDQLGAVQNTVLDTLGKNNLAAIQTGASKGMQASQELAAVLGIGMEGSAGATALADQQYELGLQEAADRRMASSEALTAANTAGTAMGTIAAEILNAQAVNYGSELNYDASLRGILGSLEAQRLANTGQANAAAIGASANGSSGYTPQVSPTDAWFNGLSPTEQDRYMMALLAGDDSLFYLDGNDPNNPQDLPQMIQDMFGLDGKGNKIGPSAESMDIYRMLEESRTQSRYRGSTGGKVNSMEESK